MFDFARLLMLISVVLTGLSRSVAADVAPAFANDTVLVMVDDKSCVYCVKWLREVGPGYSASDEGRYAPLERRTKGHADLYGLQGLRYTPTFVLLERGREVGRIVGYGGELQFWGELERLMAKTSFRPGAPTSKRPDVEETSLRRSQF
jgi:thioredoxin-related protein